MENNIAPTARVLSATFLKTDVTHFNKDGSHAECGSQQALACV
jgi:hypothetical protein